MFSNLLKNPVDMCKYSNVGGRAENEDTCGAFNKSKKEFCFVVADGLGGHGGGAQASQMAVKTISESFFENELKNPEEFKVWFQKANQEVFQIQTPDCEMKTTLVTLHIKDDFAMWAHIGDSRLYHFVDGKLVDQTFDHSVSQMAVLRGEISPEEIRGHEDRNRLLRALGRDEEIRIDVSEKISLKGKQHAFLLCTDGFWEYVYENEMEKALLHSRSAEKWIHKMVSHIKSRAKEGNDNNTAIAVIVNER